MIDWGRLFSNNGQGFALGSPSALKSALRRVANFLRQQGIQQEFLGWSNLFKIISSASRFKVKFRSGSSYARFFSFKGFLVAASLLLMGYQREWVNELLKNFPHYYPHLLYYYYRYLCCYSIILKLSISIWHSQQVILKLSCYY